MITKEEISKLVSNRLSSDMFLVDVSVSSKNVINVYIDGYNGITIDDCVDLSRYIENKLDRDKEDFELQVSSAGLGQPYKIIEQYHKNQGNDVEVILNDGQKITGTLIETDNDNITINYKRKFKTEGKKKKIEELIEKKISFNQIKTTKTIILFK